MRKLLPRLSASLFSFLVLILLHPAMAPAFSMKGLEIKSRFGDPFQAEAQILNDGKSGLQVWIGSPSDYALLGLERKSVVDSLIIDQNFVPSAPGKQIVRIYSRKPLFYPSFYLVLKASLEGNTIMGSFFLAVDFRTNLSIGVVQRKRRKPRVKKRRAGPFISANLPSEQKPGEKSQEKAEAPSEHGPELKEPPGHKPEELQAAARVGVKKKAGEKPPLKAEKQQPGIAPPDRGPKNLAVPPPQPLQTVTVRNGESLFRVAKRVVKDGKDLERAVAALWSLNRERFSNGNMNRLETGAILDYTGLGEKIRGMTLRQARLVIKKQWEEFLFLKSFFLDKDRREVIQKPLREVNLPGEMAPAKDGVEKKIYAWKASWEGEKINEYIRFYSSLFQAESGGKILNRSDWRDRKEDSFDNQEGIRVFPSHLQIRRERDHYVATFFQEYRSDKVHSFGLKALNFIPEKQKWKIFREGFEKRSLRERGLSRSYPYVVETGYYKKLEEALHQVNYLRRLGYAASLVHSNVPGKGAYYRVVLERFSTRKEGDDFAAILVRLGLLPNAVTMELPFALEAGSYGSETEALARVRELRAGGFSSYLLSTKSDGKTRMLHRVLAGAYKTRRMAENFARLLQKAQINAGVVRP